MSANNEKNTSNFWCDKHILDHLSHQLTFIENSCKLYDQGSVAEGLRIAVAAFNVLCCRKRHKSLLFSLGVENDLKLLSTDPTQMDGKTLAKIDREQRARIQSTCPSVVIFNSHNKPPSESILRSNFRSIDMTLFDCNGDMKPVLANSKAELLRLDDWLNQSIIYCQHNDKDFLLERNKLLSFIRDCYGGAHFDKKKKQENELLHVIIKGWNVACDKNTGQEISTKDEIYCILRQIGYEILESDLINQIRRLKTTSSC